MPESEAETINGLVLEILERVPEVGDVVDLGTAEVRIEKVEHHAATLVTITRKGGGKNV